MAARHSECRPSAIAFVWAASVVVALTGTVRADQPEGDTRFELARDAAHAGDLDSAMQEYAKLMLEEPDNVDYVFGYAQALFWSNEVPRSLLFLEQARRLAPDYEDVWKLEYRALLTTSDNRSSISIEEFRQMAAERFPNSEWHRAPDETTSRAIRWEFSARRDSLDNGAPDWEQINAYFDRNITANALATLSASASSRFGTTDTQFGAGGSLGVGQYWTISGQLTLSSSPSFLPDTTIDLGLNRRFEHGWVGGARWRRRDYASALVNSFGLVTERYVGKYRIAYSLDNAHLSGEQAVVHALTVNFFADSGTRIGVILAAGEEIEIVDPGVLLKTDVNSIALTGRHPVNAYLGFGWQLGTHKQGQLYRRNAIGISISGGF